MRDLLIERATSDCIPDEAMTLSLANVNAGHLNQMIRTITILAGTDQGVKVNDLLYRIKAGKSRQSYIDVRSHC